MSKEVKQELAHVEVARKESGDWGQGGSLGIEEENRLRKSLLWKLDTRMLPMIALLFLFSFLDRTNIGNAKM